MQGFIKSMKNYPMKGKGFHGLFLHFSHLWKWNAGSCMPAAQTQHFMSDHKPTLDAISSHLVDPQLEFKCFNNLFLKRFLRQMAIMF